MVMMFRLCVELWCGVLTQLAGRPAVAGGAHTLVGLRASSVETFWTADGLTAVLRLCVALAAQLHGASFHLHLRDTRTVSVTHHHSWSNTARHVYK